MALLPAPCIAARQQGRPCERALGGSERAHLGLAGRAAEAVTMAGLVAVKVELSVQGLPAPPLPSSTRWSERRGPHTSMLR